MIKSIHASKGRSRLVVVRSPSLCPGVVEQLSEQDQLPVLQHALMRTFDYWQEDESAGDALELQHYLDVGGMEEALSRHADEVFASLDEAHQQVAESVFKAITERGVDNRGIRRPTRLDLLTQIAGAELEQVVTVVEAYRHPGVTFLMPPSDVPLSPETVVDISHESLMRVWRRLEDWVDDERSLRIYELSETAELHRQDKAGLYRDPTFKLHCRARCHQPNCKLGRALCLVLIRR